MSLIKLVLLSASLVMLVGCFNDDKRTKVSGRSIFDTTIQYVDKDGNIVDELKPDVAPEPAVVTDMDRLAEAWAETGFTKEFFYTEFYNGYTCTLNERTFAGCFFAAQAMTKDTDGAQATLVVKGTPESPILGEVIRDLGWFTVRKSLPLFSLETPITAEQASEWNKMVIDLKKDQVERLLALYEAEIAPLAVVKESQTQVKALSDTFGEVRGVQVACSMSAEYVDSEGRTCPQIIESLSSRLETAINGMIAASTKIEETVAKDFMDQLNAAFEKIDPKQESYIASAYYNIYLQNSNDGHARIELLPSVKAALEAASPQSTPLYGIGATVMMNEESKSIFFDPAEDGPAGKAGMTRNSRLISIIDENGVTVDSFASTEDAVKLLRGVLGTEVTVTVEDGATKQIKTFTMVRAPIPRNTYKFEVRQVNGAAYGYLSLSTFQDDKVGRAMREYIAANNARVKGWILDLRDNGGGFVHVAGEVISPFVQVGTPFMAVSSEEDVDKANLQRPSTTMHGRITEKPLVILVNARSASASEIVSGTLQESGRAVVVGVTTFGKGSVQSAGKVMHGDIPHYPVWAYAQIKVAVYQTTSRYFLPSGRTPEWVGVEPDLKVLTAPDAVELFEYRERDVIPFSLKDVAFDWARPADQITRNEALTQCVDTAGTAKQTWAAQEALAFKTTYQELVTYDVLTCLERVAQPQTQEDGLAIAN